MSDPSAALGELGAVAQAQPRDPAAWYRWAVGLARAGQRTAALQAAQHALPLATRAAHAPLALGLGKLLEILEHHREAMHAYRRATQLDPGQTDAHVHLGSLLRRLGDPRAATLVLRAATARAPLSAALALELAEALLAGQQAGEALPQTERARALGAPAEAVLRLLARVQEAQGRLEACLETLAQLPRLDDEDVQVLVAAARKQALRGDTGGVEAALDRARVTAVSVESRRAIGVVLFELGALEPAIETLRAVVTALPADGVALLALGRAQAAAGRTDDAIATLRAAIRARPTDAQALVALAAIVGDPTEASVLRGQAAALAPDDEDIRDARAGARASTPRRSSPGLATVTVPPRRAQPRAATGGITSDLSSFSLPELLEFLLQQRATGTLLLRDAQGQEGSLELFEGQLAGGRYPGGRRLSDVLLEEDLVSRTDLLRAISGVVDGDAEATLTAAVLESQLVERDALAQVVTRRIKAALAALVPWREGQAMFHREVATGRPRPEIRVETRWALMEAVQQLDHDARAGGRSVRLAPESGPAVTGPAPLATVATEAPRAPPPGGPDPAEGL